MYPRGSELTLLGMDPQEYPRAETGFSDPGEAEREGRDEEGSVSGMAWGSQQNAPPLRDSPPQPRPLSPKAPLAVVVDTAADSVRATRASPATQPCRSRNLGPGGGGRESSVLRAPRACTRLAGSSRRMASGGGRRWRRGLCPGRE